MFSDKVIAGVDNVLRTLFSDPIPTRPVPGRDLPEGDLSDDEKAHAVALMRVNHVGEVCAQALYLGQAWLCRDASIRGALEQAAREEGDHLFWTAQRIAALGGRKSVLNPLWYTGALSFGLLAGKLGNGWNMGFLAETERQVEAHLDGHLAILPTQDVRSRAVVCQMKVDEAQHAAKAEQLGARMLPAPARLMMRLAAKVMTVTAYRL